ncbi:MAG: HlyC/CorC family transporter [Ruminococcaceae bacterium]|nr:HlyC/CorC family transporter [Oscillospiraceae bacterium]
MNDDGSIPLRFFASSTVSVDTGDLVLQILLVVFLIFLNAFFAASEFALMNLNDNKIKKIAEKGNKKAKFLLRIIDDPSKFLSTIQVGITFSGFLSSAVASSSFAVLIVDKLAQEFTWVANNKSMMTSITLVLLTLVLSFITLIFGELVPKRIGMRYSEKLSLKIVTPLRFMGVIFAPFIALLTVCVNGVLRILGINPHEDEETATEEEIMLMVNEGQEKGLIGDEESEMISNIFEFDDKTALDIMTHRTEICSLKLNDSYLTVLNLATSERYSRFPVYDGNIDNIVGIIHIKDLLKVDEFGFKIEDIMRAPCFVPESQKIDDVLKTLQENSTHLAIVVDEYGGTSGLVTMEDILEELVGNIRDEYDAEEIEEDNNLIKKINDSTYQIDGLSAIDDVNEALDTDLPTEEYETISGFVIALLGEIPEENEHPKIEFDRYRFTVIESNEKFIASVKLEILPEAIDRKSDLLKE